MSLDYSDMKPWENAWGREPSSSYGVGYGESLSGGSMPSMSNPYPKPSSPPPGPQMQDPSQFGISPRPWDSAWGKQPSTGYGSSAPGPLHPSDPSRPWENRREGDSPYGPLRGLPREGRPKQIHEGYIRGQGWGRTDLSPQERHQVARAMRQGPPTDAERQEAERRRGLYNQSMMEDMRNQGVFQGAGPSSQAGVNRMMQTFRNNPYGEWAQNQNWSSGPSYLASLY